MLSAHAGTPDRRIVAEANSLARFGRDVTLLSVPIDWSGSGLDERVNLLVGGDAGGVESKLSQVKRAIPQPLFGAAKRTWYMLNGGPSRGFKRYAQQLVPPGPFDVIHCHDLDTLEAGVSLRHRWPEASLVYDAHELYPYQVEDPAYQRYWSAIESRLIQQAQSVITVSPSFARKMESLYHIQGVRVIQNAFGSVGNHLPISDDAFRQHFQIAETDHRRRVIFQGGQSAGRGLVELTRAFELLREEALLCFLGAGDLQPKLREIAGENVRFGALVSQEELIGYLQNADLGVIPYPGSGLLNNELCSPNKLFEYIEAGVPVCANDLIEVRRVIESTGIGAVHEFTGQQSIADAIRNTLARTQTGEFPAQRFAEAQQQLGWSKQEEVLFDIYDALEPAQALKQAHPA